MTPIGQRYVENYFKGAGGDGKHRSLWQPEAMARHMPVLQNLRYHSGTGVIARTHLRRSFLCIKEQRRSTCLNKKWTDQTVEAFWAMAGISRCIQCDLLCLGWKATWGAGKSHKPAS